MAEMNSSMDSPLFAKQPIFNNQRQVVAYELLFRQTEVNAADYTDGDHASSHVLLSTFGDQQVQDTLGQHKAFINYTRNFLLEPPPIPKDKIVIEVMEDIQADDDIIEALKNLKKEGYEIALDDFFLTENTKIMLQYADIIKVDVLAIDAEKLEHYVKVLQPLKVKLLAEKIEDYEMLETCIKLGFDFFQGYFLCKPEVVRGTRVQSSKQSMLRIISTLNKEDVPHKEIVNTISTDPALSFKILKLVNSPAIGLSKNIESLAQAVTLLGLDKIKSWGTFLLMASNDNKPEELSVLTMCRAKLCESLGGFLGDANFAQSCFTLGLLSNLDSFLDMDLETMVGQLQLSDSLEGALLHKTGLAGKLLQMVYHFERGDWQSMDWDWINKNNISEDDLNRCYCESSSWAISLVQGAMHM